MEIDNLGSAESMTLTVLRLPEGKFSVKSGTSQIDTVILADQVPSWPIRCSSSASAVSRSTYCGSVRRPTPIAASRISPSRRRPMKSDEVTVSHPESDSVTPPKVTPSRWPSRDRMASLRRRRKLGKRVVNGIRISDAEIEELRSRGYDSEDLVEAIETFLSDLLV